MVKFVAVCSEKEEDTQLKDHQLLVDVEHMQKMVIEFENPCTSNLDGYIKPSGLESQTKQLQNRLRSCSADIFDSVSVEPELYTGLLSQMVPCVGCRRCVEKLYDEIQTKGYSHALSPFVINDRRVLTLHPSILTDKAIMAKLWDDIWNVMSKDCKAECCLVQCSELEMMLEKYLLKHRFCNECKQKVIRAYDLLVGKTATKADATYNASLYAGLKFCDNGNHVHVKQCTGYLNMLVQRAEPELYGTSRERHAKTIEIAQGEVLTCVGLFLYDRLHRVLTALRTLHQTFQIMFCCANIAIYNKFQLYWEENFEESRFDSLCAELQDAAADPSKVKPIVRKKPNGSTKTKKKSNKANSTNILLDKNQNSPTNICDKVDCAACRVRYQQQNGGIGSKTTLDPVKIRTDNIAQQQQEMLRSHSSTGDHDDDVGFIDKRRIARSLSPVKLQKHRNENKENGIEKSLSTTSTDVECYGQSTCDNSVESECSKGSSFHDLGYCSQELSPSAAIQHKNSCCTAIMTSLCEKNILSANSLVPIVFENGAEDEVEARQPQNHEETSCDCPDGNSFISAEEINLFDQCHPQVNQERLDLRRRLKEQFVAMQARLAAGVGGK